MSLLLLMPQTTANILGWTVVGNPATGWTTSNYDYKNVWGEWEVLTWGAIQSAGLTWGNMAGYMFNVTATAPITTWTVV